MVTFSPPPGSVFVLASAAVDSYGRVVLAGLTRPLPTDSTPDPVLSSAALMRFNADGTPDTSFGNGGTLITDFGLGDPVAGGGHYPGASVGLRDVVIDSQNRPVISGAYVSEVGGCTRYVNSKGFIARLTESGALDPTFGSGGIRTLSTIATIGQIAPRSGGYVALAAGGPLCKGPKARARCSPASTKTATCCRASARSASATSPSVKHRPWRSPRRARSSCSAPRRATITTRR